MMAAAGHTVAVIVPAYNAAGYLGPVLDGILERIPATDIWVVDDGSTDGTAEVAKQRQTRLIRQSPNQGKASALRRGFHSTSEYELVITMDADGQHDPADLPKFLAAADEGDLVVGARPLAGRMPWHRQIGNRIASWVTTALAGQAVPDSQSGYRMHRRAVIDAIVDTIPADSDGYLFETEILVRTARSGFRLATVPIPAVYEDEPSHFRPTREIPRFLGLFMRLTRDLLSGKLSPHTAKTSGPADDTDPGASRDGE
jgi:glycosyltransferase involved in cell wall biosynthesis